jgi:hypothetical protein
MDTPAAQRFRPLNALDSPSTCIIGPFFRRGDDKDEAGDERQSSHRSKIYHLICKKSRKQLIWTIHLSRKTDILDILATILQTLVLPRRCPTHLAFHHRLPPSPPYVEQRVWVDYGQQNPYDNPYNPNPYDPHAHTPSPFDNPNSLYTNPGQVIGHSTPTPDPFTTPTSLNHPSLYDPHQPYGAPSPSPASDRYNSPAPLPGQARVTSPPLPQPQNDYLNPSSAAHRRSPCPLRSQRSQRRPRRRRYPSPST